MFPFAFQPVTTRFDDELTSLNWNPYNALEADPLYRPSLSNDYLDNFLDIARYWKDEVKQRVLFVLFSAGRLW